MSQISAALRKAHGGYLHWCPGCNEVHFIAVERPGGPQWTFDGNAEQPTFSPSVRVTWHGGYGPERSTKVCHYFIHAGQIEFCGDSTHALAGKTVPLPTWPHDDKYD